MAGQKLTARAELTTGFTADDLMHTVNGGASYKAKQGTLIGAILGLPGSIQTVHVAKNGNDSTGNGTRARPFLTIAAALSSVSDASTSKRYVIFVHPGGYTESSFVLKPFVWVIGLGNSQGGPVRVSVTGNKVTTSAAFLTGSNRAGLRDIYFSGSTGVEIVTTGATGSNVFELQNVGMNGDLTFNPGNAADFLDYVVGRVFGTITLKGGNNFLQQVYSSGGNAVNTDTTSGLDCNADFLACTFAAALNATSSGGKSNNTRLICSICDGVATADQAATTLTIAAAALSNPPVSTNSGVLTISQPFIASDPSKWSGSPTTVSDAINRIAAVVGVTPIP